MSRPLTQTYWIPVVLSLYLALGMPGCVGTDMDVDIPEAPDMGPLLETYSFPSAPFSVDTLDNWVDDVQDTLDLFGRFDGFSPIVATVFGVGDEAETGSSALSSDPAVEVHRFPVVVSGQDVQGDGYLEIKRICGGWGPNQTVDEENNGYVRVNAVFHDSGFDAIVWGEARNCKYTFDNHDLLINGDINIHTGTLLPTVEDGNINTDTAGAELLVDFNGELKVDDMKVASTFSFKALVTEQLVEFSLDSPDGNVLFFSSEQKQGFIASNGTWTCDFQKMDCEEVQ